MKLISSLLILFVLFLAGCNTATEDKKEQANEKVKVDPGKVVLIDMDVNGMTCTGCENTIKSGVSELDGVVSVEASHVDAKTYVKADTSIVNIDKIKEAISAKGYQVVGSSITGSDDSSSPQEESAD